MTDGAEAEPTIDPATLSDDELVAQLEPAASDAAPKEEPPTPASLATALVSGERLCGLVKVKEWYCRGLGHFVKGQMFPIEVWNAAAVMVEASREDRAEPSIEIVIGRPSYPQHTSAAIVSERPKLDRIVKRIEPDHPIAKLRLPKDPLYGFGSTVREKIKKTAERLLVEKPSSFFAEKSPLDFAIDHVLAEENAKLDRERKRHQDAFDWCLAQVTKRAERLRREKDEFERRAREAEEQADKLDAIMAASPELAEVYALRARLQQHAYAMNNVCAPKERDENRIRWGGPPDQYAEIRALISEGVEASNKNDTASLRVICDKLDAASEPRLASPLPNGSGTIGIREYT